MHKKIQHRRQMKNFIVDNDTNNLEIVTKKISKTSLNYALWEHVFVSAKTETAKNDYDVLSYAINRQLLSITKRAFKTLDNDIELQTLKNINRSTEPFVGYLHSKNISSSIKFPIIRKRHQRRNNINSNLERLVDHESRAVI